jgi:hypothetical protein
VIIEVPPDEVYALGRALHGSADLAADAAPLLAGLPPVGGPLQPALDGFLDCHRMAAQAVAGELDWLGRTVASVAVSWLGLDRELLAPRGQAVPR